jgi:hypothetical protein
MKDEFWPKRSHVSTVFLTNGARDLMTSGGFLTRKDRPLRRVRRATVWCFKRLVSFKSVCMGRPSPGRVGPFLAFQGSRAGLFYDLSARETCPLHRSPRVRSGPGLPPQISREKTAPSCQSLQKSPSPSRCAARCKTSASVSPCKHF